MGRVSGILGCLPVLANVHLSDALVDVFVVAVPAFIAAVASMYVAKVTRANRRSLAAQDEMMDTGNGKDLGSTVHDIAQTVEILAAQQHTNTSELLTTQERVQSIGERLADWIDHSTDVHNRILTGHDAVVNRLQACHMAGCPYHGGGLPKGEADGAE